MTPQTTLDRWKLELSVKAKNGVNFMLAAAVIWSIITYIWTLPYSPKDKCALTFIVGALMLPLAWVFSKLLNTTWSVKENPLDSLGIQLNVAQLFYFPLLFLLFGKLPDYFVMAYAVITGAHFFPYGWYYKAIAYYVMAGVISVGAFLISINVAPAQLYIVPLFMVVSLLVLAGWLWVIYKANKRAYESGPANVAQLT